MCVFKILTKQLYMQFGQGRPFVTIKTGYFTVFSLRLHSFLVDSKELGLQILNQQKCTTLSETEVQRAIQVVLAILRIGLPRRAVITRRGTFSSVVVTRKTAPISTLKGQFVLFAFFNTLSLYLFNATLPTGRLPRSGRIIKGHRRSQNTVDKNLENLSR